MSGITLWLLVSVLAVAALLCYRKWRKVRWSITYMLNRRVYHRGRYHSFMAAARRTKSGLPAIDVDMGPDFKSFTSVWTERVK